jgi:hypothetical protein
MPKSLPPKLARWTKLRQRAQQTQVKSRRGGLPSYPTRVVRSTRGRTRVP